MTVLLQRAYKWAWEGVMVCLIKISNSQISQLSQWVLWGRGSEGIHRSKLKAQTWEVRSYSLWFSLFTKSSFPLHLISCLPIQTDWIQENVFSLTLQKCWNLLTLPNARSLLHLDPMIVLSCQYLSIFLRSIHFHAVKVERVALQELEFPELQIPIWWQRRLKLWQKQQKLELRQLITELRKPEQGLEPSNMNPKSRNWLRRLDRLEWEWMIPRLGSNIHFHPNLTRIREIPLENLLVIQIGRGIKRREKESKERQLLCKEEKDRWGQKNRSRKKRRKKSRWNRLSIERDGSYEVRKTHERFERSKSLSL